MITNNLSKQISTIIAGTITRHSIPMKCWSTGIYTVLKWMMMKWRRIKFCLRLIVRNMWNWRRKKGLILFNCSKPRTNNGTLSSVSWVGASALVRMRLSRRGRTGRSGSQVWGQTRGQLWPSWRRKATLGCWNHLNSKHVKISCPSWLICPFLIKCREKMQDISSDSPRN